MAADRGQASVEWVAVVLLVALALGAVATVVPRVDGRALGEEIARRIGGERGAADAAAGHARPLHAGAVARPVLPARGRRLRELLRKGARRGVAANGLACFLRKSTEPGDPDRVGDDVVDAVNCLNPVDGWTGELRERGR